MATPEVDPSIFKQAFEWAWAGVLALVGVVYGLNEKKHDQRREGEIALHKKIEAHDAADRAAFRSLEDKIDTNHREIMNHLLNK